MRQKKGQQSFLNSIAESPAQHQPDVADGSGRWFRPEARFETSSSALRGPATACPLASDVVRGPSSEILSAAWPWAVRKNINSGFKFQTVQYKFSRLLACRSNH